MDTYFEQHDDSPIQRRDGASAPGRPGGEGQRSAILARRIRNAVATIKICSPDFLQRISTGRGSELAFSRAYVAGDVEIEADIYAVVAPLDRLQDYRNINDAPFDAISSIGMFEHVGMSRLAVYFDKVNDLLVPGGRFLNHAINRPVDQRRGRIDPNGFRARYVFPDGELRPEWWPSKRTNALRQSRSLCPIPLPSIGGDWKRSSRHCTKGVRHDRINRHVNPKVGHRAPA